ncbi:hypothetical protein [Legionella gresilensis]|uniref:hypothetical protein n=1 Tax=Legionella gresilensis TaxID=91823 RepID=UPI0010415E57|nr:hypothetical protein [Legionella gresilensis]
MPKYIFENGVMKLDPNYQAQHQNQGTLPTTNPQALTIISTTQDMQDASHAQQLATGKPMQVAEATIASMQIMQDEDYLNQFKTQQKLDGGELLDGLSNVFARYEVPIGLVNKLLALTEYSLNFIIDDSGSMNSLSDLPMSAAHPIVKQMRDPQGTRASMNGKLTRWEEAEDRIHIILDMLAYLPINKIKLGFLNNTSRNLEFSHAGRTPEQFAAEYHQKVSQLFSSKPGGGTPLYHRLSEAFSKSTGNTMHYAFTDGEPNDASVEDVKKLVLNRPNPKMNPLTFISCTENDEEAEWMKEIEEAAPFTAELDDFNSERKEVYKDQGPAFPFTRGFWLICQLVAAINPYDLDALDESVPFTKKTMNDLMGRSITIEEYRRYFQSNPNAQRFIHLSQQFEREDILAHHIVNPQSSMPNNMSNPVYPPQIQQPMPQGQFPPPYNPAYFNNVNQPTASAPPLTNNIGSQGNQPQQPFYQKPMTNLPPQQNNPHPSSYGNYQNTFFNQPPLQSKPTQQQPTTQYPPSYNPFQP